MASSESSDTIRRVLRAAANESETLRLLRDDPESLQQRFRLTPGQVASLKRADILLRLRPRRPRPGQQAGSTITFDTGTTITAGPSTITFDTGTTITARLSTITFDTGTTITAGPSTLTFDTGSTITAERIRDVLSSLASESSILDRLRRQPETLEKDFGIDPELAERLKAAKVEILMAPREQ